MLSCSDNIAFGMAVSEKFLDPRVGRRLSLTLLNIFNFETGRQVCLTTKIEQIEKLTFFSHRQINFFFFFFSFLKIIERNMIKQVCLLN